MSLEPCTNAPGRRSSGSSTSASTGIEAAEAMLSPVSITRCGRSVVRCSRKSSLRRWSGIRWMSLMCSTRIVRVPGGRIRSSTSRSVKRWISTWRAQTWAAAAAPSPRPPTAPAAARAGRTSVTAGGLPDDHGLALGEAGAGFRIRPDHVPLAHRAARLVAHLDLVARRLDRPRRLAEDHARDVGHDALLSRIGRLPGRLLRRCRERLAGQALVGAGHVLLPGGQGDRVAPDAPAAEHLPVDLETAGADVGVGVAEPHGGGHLAGEADVPGVALLARGAGLAARRMARDRLALAGRLRVLEILLEGPRHGVGDLLLDRLVAVGAGDLHRVPVAVQDLRDGLRLAVGAPGGPGGV